MWQNIIRTMKKQSLSDNLFFTMNIHSIIHQQEQLLLFACAPQNPHQKNETMKPHLKEPEKSEKMNLF